MKIKKYIIRLLETVIDKSFNNRRLPDKLIPQKNNFKLDFTTNCHRRHTHDIDFIYIYTNYAYNKQ